MISSSSSSSSSFSHQRANTGQQTVQLQAIINEKVSKYPDIPIVRPIEQAANIGDIQGDANRLVNNYINQPQQIQTASQGEQNTQTERVIQLQQARPQEEEWIPKEALTRHIRQDRLPTQAEQKKQLQENIRRTTQKTTTGEVNLAASHAAQYAVDMLATTAAVVDIVQETKKRKHVISQQSYRNRHKKQIEQIKLEHQQRAEVIIKMHAENSQLMEKFEAQQKKMCLVCV
jgi:hypothetical protein